MNDRRLLELLSQSFPNINTASTEIINLEAILNLPKGNEHFVADLHGEYDAFNYIMRNASGNIKRKIHDLFGNTMRESEIRQLCALIYYPEKKLPLIFHFLITHGSLYSVCNSNLLFHAAVPLNEDGEFVSIEFNGKKYKGKELYDYLNWVIRSAFLSETNPEDKKFAIDYFCGIFGAVLFLPCSIKAVWPLLKDT